MVLFDYVVEIVDLAHHNWHVLAGIDRIDRRLVGAALVHGKLVGDVVIAVRLQCARRHCAHAHDPQGSVRKRRMECHVVCRVNLYAGRTSPSGLGCRRFLCGKIPLDSVTRQNRHFVRRSLSATANFLTLTVGYVQHGIFAQAQLPVDQTVGLSSGHLRQYFWRQLV
jgi:hypothetical protein